VLCSGQTLLAPAFSRKASDAPVDDGKGRSHEGEADDQNVGDGTIGGEGRNAPKNGKRKTVWHWLLLKTACAYTAQSHPSALGGKGDEPSSLALRHRAR
jgi:hypothetical protein